MVHARAFSFTDDTTSVQLPSIPATIPPLGLEGPLSRPHSLHTARILFQLRRAQSSWYQELFQSSRDPLRQSSTYIWQMCHDMRSWSESFPPNLSPAIKSLFDLELLYSYVYCLAPSCRVPAVSDLGKTLIFEYSLAYIDKIYPISKDTINAAFYTYHDALRVYFIGSQFIAVLSDHADQLLHGIVPYVAAMAGGPPLPPIPNIGRSDNVDRSILCIDHIIEILKKYGERWEDSKALQSNFEAQAGPLSADLRRRRHHLNTQARNSRSPGDEHGQISPQAEDWGNLDQVYGPSSIQGVPLQVYRQ